MFPGDRDIIFDIDKYTFKGIKFALPHDSKS